MPSFSMRILCVSSARNPPYLRKHLYSLSEVASSGRSCRINMGRVAIMCGLRGRLVCKPLFRYSYSVLGDHFLVPLHA